MYGFSDNTIKMLIQELPEAEKCASYIWQDFEGTTKARPSTANSGDDQPMEEDDAKPEDEDAKMQDPTSDKPAANIKLHVNSSGDHAMHNNNENGTQPATQEGDAGFGDFESDQPFPDVTLNY